MVDSGEAGSHIDDDCFPLSFAQQRLWLLDQLAPGRASYNIAGAFRLGVPLQPDVLTGALNEIVRRHEILRTTFHAAEDGQPFQVVAPSLLFELPLVDLTDLQLEEREAEALHQARAIARMPFDLGRGPLLRARLLRVSAAEHIFVVAMHHIVSDGWSMGILFDELAALYSAFAAGRPSPLPELPIQYADYSVWQREWLQEKALAVQTAYWRKQLAGLPLLQLPTDFPRPLVTTQRGASLQLQLSDELTSGLRMLSRRQNVTLFMTLLAAFQVLLHRYTGQTDIVVGSPTAGRTRAELEKLIGFFVNMLVMRTHLAGEPSFREVLTRVRNVALEAYAHQDMPFEKLVEELQPSRDLSRNPLFQVAFQLFQEGTAAQKTNNAEAVTLLDVEKGTANFDLALSFWESGSHLRGRLEYSTDLFTETTVAHLAGHFEKLLEGIIANPDCSIIALPLLTSAERMLLLGKWSGAGSMSRGALLDENGGTKSFGDITSSETNTEDNEALRDSDRNAGAAQNRHTTASQPPHLCAHRLFEEQVRRAPDAPAVVLKGICLSYDEVNRRANQIAHFLRRLGLKADDLVALCLDRSPALVIAALGVLKAGGAYVPLNPAYPATRLSFMLADAGVCAVLTETQWVSRLPGEAPAMLVLDRDQDLLSKESEANPDLETEPESLAYAIYTSGSTGQPKGVLIPHRGLSNLVAWHRAAYDVTDADRATLLATPAFDASSWEIWPYLAAGASLHIPAAEIRDTPHELVRWFNSEGITLSFVPTPLAELLLQESWPERTTLRALLTGGDLLHRGPGSNLPCRLFNHYGPTENTVVSTWAPLPCWKEGDPPPTIGRPITNVQVYILDSHHQPVPAGVPGELCLGGTGLARSYLNRPELTAEKFVPHPFSDEQGARLYRTGDSVRFRSDGNLEFLGRLDQQVKIRGFRIELGEIEAVLSAHPDVREAAVIMREEAGGERRLVAYVVPHRIPEDQSGGTARMLINALADLPRSRLPDYMVPSAWMLLDELPRSPNGKVNRAVLPAPDRIETGSSFQAPRTPVECELANIWTELLGVSQVGLHDDFFQRMGGHSLLATRLISRIRNSFGVELPLRAVFGTPTVAGLAAAIVQQQAATADTGALEQLLRELEALPDDTARALLSGERMGDE